MIPSFIDPSNFRHYSHEGMIYQPCNGAHHYTPQFLELKRRLMEKGIKEVELCGQARKVCVKDVFDLVTQTNNKPDVLAYKAAADYLGIPFRDYARIFEKKLSCRVLEHLCS